MTPNAGNGIELTGQAMTYGGGASAVVAWGLSLSEMAAIVEIGSADAEEAGE